MRHAKAADAGPIADLDRPLSVVGRAQCGQVTEYLLSNDLRPELVVRSHALRVAETVAGIEEAVAGAEVIVEPRAYEAGCGTLFELIGDHAGRAAVVMVVGHNPAVAQAITTLAERGDGVPPPDDVPAASVAVLSIDATWAGLEPGVGRLESFVRPADLG